MVVDPDVVVQSEAATPFLLPSQSGILEYQMPGFNPSMTTVTIRSIPASDGACPAASRA